MSVYESLEQVKDRESFLSFIKDLDWDSANNKDEQYYSFTENRVIAEKQ